MVRKKITANVQKSILINSRRRCAICFGLQRDTSLKNGQIAHLDQDSANDKEDNLAYLCMDHHDEYDSITRQRKNFTVEEVKHYRSELYRSVKNEFDPIPILNSSNSSYKIGDRMDTITGHYILENTFDLSAEVKITRLLDGRYHVSGEALWGADSRKEYGPNFGDIEFIEDIVDNKLVYKHDFPGDFPPYIMTITFSDTGLHIEESDMHMTPYGMNVRFTGSYVKA